MKPGLVAKVALLWVLWAALAGSILACAAVAFLQTRTTALADASFPQTLYWVLLGMGLSNALVSIVIRQFLLVRAVRRGTLDLQTSVGLQRAFVLFLVTWALSETLGIFGLVIVFLGAHFASGIPFWGLALLLMLLHRPTSNFFRRDSSTE